MKLYKLIIYRLAKKDTPLAIIERIRHAFNTSDIDHHDTKFFISDSQHGVSGIDRLLKKIPDLDHFRYSVGTSDDFEQRLSNLSVRWEGANPKRFTNSLGMGDLIKIVGGIPRRYPLNKLTVIFDNIPILRRNPIDSKDEPIPFIAKGDVGYTRLFSPSVTGGSDYPSPCIRVQSDWWISGRNNFVDAIVELGDLADGIPQLELNDGERKFLSSIGEIYHERVFAVPSNKEEAAAVYENIIAGELIVQSCYDDGNLICVDFPYQLKPLTISDDIPGLLSVKKEITTHFKKRGFSYNTKYSNGGVYTMTRMTKNHHLVKLTFARGKFDADVSCVGSIEGALWKHEFDLPAAHANMRSYQITRQIDVDHQIGNIAAAYDAIEKRIIETIDELYDPEPTWLTYL